jgi:hypothetical protein
MTDIDPLREELAKPEYASLSDQQAADAINSKVVDVVVLVENAEIKRQAIMVGIWPGIIAGQRDANPQKAGLCIGVIDWLNDTRMPRTDMDLPVVQQMLAGLVAFGLMTQEQATAIDALKHQSVPWTEHNGLPEVGIGMIRNARK